MASFRYYRLVITATNGGGSCYIGQIQLYNVAVLVSPSNMTALNLPAPYVVSAGNWWEGDANWRRWFACDAFIGVSPLGGMGYNTGVNSTWWQIDLGAITTTTKYRIYDTYHNICPRNFRLEGSNSGSFTGEQTLLDIRSGIGNWGADAFVEYTFNVTTQDLIAAADMPSRDFAHNALGDPTFNLQSIQTPNRNFYNKRNIEDGIEKFLVYTNGVGFADWTVEANNAVVNDFPLIPPVYDALNATYIGYRRRFDTVLVDVSVNTIGAGQFIWEYWNGAAWVGLVDFYDSSDSFKNGNLARINHTPQLDWVQNNINGSTLYWLRYRRDLFAMITTARGTEAWVGYYDRYKRLVNYTRAKTLIGR